MILAAHSIAIPCHPGTVVIATVPFAHPVRARVTGVPQKSRLLHVPGVRSETAENERRPTVVEAASRLSGVEDAVQREQRVAAIPSHADEAGVTLRITNPGTDE